MELEMSNGDFGPSMPWLQAKGIPSNNDNITDIVYSCYNCLVKSLDPKTRKDSSLHWYNKQIYTCCIKVDALLQNGEFSLPADDLCVSYDAVISKFEDIVQNSYMFCSLFHSLEALGLCAIVIWNIKSAQEGKCCKAHCLKLARIFNTMPFDCVMNDNKKCRQSLTEQAFTFLRTVFEERALGDVELQRDLLSQYRFYVEAYFNYHKKKYKDALHILNEFVQKLQEPRNALGLLNFANAYNLMGCCYAHLNANQTAMVYFRKALQCRSSNISSCVFNVAVLYREMGKSGVAAQAMEILVPMLELKESWKGTKISLVIHHQHGMQLATFPTSVSHWGFQNKTSDLRMSLYVAAHQLLQAQKHEKAVELYSKLENPGQALCLAPHTYAEVSVPSMEQIKAENQLAICEGKMGSHEEEISHRSIKQIKAELNQYACQFSNCHIKLLQSNEIDDKQIQEFIYRGKQLFHYLCYVLCFTKSLVENGSTDSLLICFELFEMWKPTIYSLDATFEGINEDVKNEANVVMKYLNRIQAKLLLNKALLMSLEMEEKEKIFQTLQTIFKFDSQDIEIRWTVTLILWKLGEKGEGCKIWMKTRGMDFKMNSKEILSLLEKRSSEQSEAKTALYRKDAAILKEILRTRRENSL